MQASLELDIISVEYDEDDMAMAGDMVSCRVFLCSYFVFLFECGAYGFIFCCMHLHCMPFAIIHKLKNVDIRKFIPCTQKHIWLFLCMHYSKR